jgi:hypothetical protein
MTRVGRTATVYHRVARVRTGWSLNGQFLPFRVVGEFAAKRPFRITQIMRDEIEENMWLPRSQWIFGRVLHENQTSPTDSAFCWTSTCASSLK